MIKTKSVYDPIDLKTDDFRVLVMRKWPRGIGYKKHAIHKWSKELGPSRELLDKWNSNEITWEDYVKQYCSEQSFSENVYTKDDYVCNATGMKPYSKPDST